MARSAGQSDKILRADPIGTLWNTALSVGREKLIQPEKQPAQNSNKQFSHNSKHSLHPTAV